MHSEKAGANKQSILFYYLHHLNDWTTRQEVASNARDNTYGRKINSLNGGMKCLQTSV